MPSLRIRMRHCFLQVSALPLFTNLVLRRLFRPASAQPMCRSLHVQALSCMACSRLRRLRISVTAAEAQRSAAGARSRACAAAAASGDAAAAVSGDAAAAATPRALLIW